MLPFPKGPSHWALFLDFDGTLTEIAATPDSVHIDDGLPPLLTDLSRVMSDAVAIVSGRPILQIDRFLQPATLPVAGLHGLEHRRVDGVIVQRDAHRHDLETVKMCMVQLADRDERLLLEDKGLTVALHYRNAQDRAPECRKIVQSAVDQIPGLTLLEGKMVLEARPVDMHKGKAIQVFMAEAPFNGRVPVMVGDDVTDEDGFELVNSLQGITVKVGPGDTQARYRLPAVEDVLVWLRQLRDGLDV